MSKIRSELRPKTAAPSPLLMAMAGGAHSRSGEGYLAKPVQNVGDGGATTFGLSFAEIPVPPRRYAADVCNALIHRQQVLIIFGQDSVYGETLDSALQVRMTPSAVRAMLLSMEKMDGQSLEDVIRIEHIGKEALTVISSVPAQEAKVVANFAAIAMAGMETCIDFFHASPFAMHKMNQTGQLYVEPIVRVDLQTGLFVSLLEKLTELCASLPKQSEVKI